MIFTACAEKMGPEGIEIGTYSDDRYVHPAGNFSIEVPKSYRRVVQESDSPGTYGVGFLHDSGSLMKFEICQLPKAIFADIDTSQAGEALKSLFNRRILSKIVKKFPETQIVEDDIISIDGCGEAYYTVLEVYFEHPLFSLGSIRTEDYIRGYLIFICDDRIIVLSEHMAGTISDALEERGKCGEIPDIVLKKLRQSQKLYRDERCISKKNEVIIN